MDLVKGKKGLIMGVTIKINCLGHITETRRGRG